MSKTYRAGVLVTVLIWLVLSFGGCAQKSGYDMDRRFIFGMGELISDTMSGQVDNSITGEWVAEKVGQLGVKTMRVWMHHINIFTRAEKTDEVSLNREMADRYHRYFEQLKDNGVERILVMNHTFISPYGFMGDDMAVPDPEEDYELYLRFLDIYERCYEIIAQEFGDIDYFEPGNEFDHPNGIFYIGTDIT